MLTQLLIALVLTPIIGLVCCIFVPKLRENIIFSVAFTTMLAELALLLFMIYQWATAGAKPVLATIGSLYSSQNYTFSLEFYFDGLSAVFLATAAAMTSLVFIFSKYYLHREPGFKRFYYTVLLFFTGLSFIIVAGNFEVLLIGWELIGISSVLLIAFYRDRFLPARNALKVFSVYRIADAFLLAAIWYAHHIFNQSVNFSEFSSLAAQYGDQLALLGLLLFGAALIKSAGFPFSYWLPRAMEGPTSSSAIFYGALSVHMGLFLLLRTYPLWEGSLWLRVVILASGLVTAIVASAIARVQSSTKTQIAYASTAQIGIMFIMLAVGLPWLALILFVCNALLRTYQLLISPSIVGYLVHDQFFYFVSPVQKIKNTFLGRIRATFYVLSIKEWNMNTVATNYLWRPLKSVGRSFAVLDKPLAQIISVAILLLFASTVALPTSIPTNLALAASVAAAISGIIFYIRAYTTKGKAKTCWNLIMIGNLWCIFFLNLATAWSWKYLIMYGAGVLAAFIAGHICLGYLSAKGQPTTLGEYQGATYPFKELGHVFFIICLLFMAFPISPSFLAQEALLSQVPTGQAYLLLLFCACYLLAGISVMRLYVKVFFGPHKASYHELAYKSS